MRRARQALATGDQGGPEGSDARVAASKIGTAMGSNPGGKATGLLTMAKAAMDAMKSGDTAVAAKAADTLEKALGAGSVGFGADANGGREP